MTREAVAEREEATRSPWEVRITEVPTGASIERGGAWQARIVGLATSPPGVDKRMEAAPDPTDCIEELFRWCGEKGEADVGEPLAKGAGLTGPAPKANGDFLPEDGAAEKASEER